MRTPPRGIRRPLALENEGYLSVFSIGSGSAFGKTLYQNNYLLIKGRTHLMIDCGTRTPQALHELGVPITKIRNFLITHSHADHTGGLEEAILMNRYVVKQKPTIVITPEYQRMLWRDTLKGGASFNERHGKSYLRFTDYFLPAHPEKIPDFPRDAWEIDFGGISLVLFRTKHIPDSAVTWKDSAFSVGLVADGRFLFTGDTRFDADIFTDVFERFPIEMVFHDVQFFPGGVHAPFQDLCGLPDRIKSMTYLMHYPDTFEEKAGTIAENGFAGFVRQQHYYDFE